MHDKQTEMVKTVSAAENAINKLQVNTVSIEVCFFDILKSLSNRFCLFDHFSAYITDSALHDGGHVLHCTAFLCHLLQEMAK